MYLMDSESFDNFPKMSGIAFSKEYIFNSSEGFKIFLENNVSGDILGGKYLIQYPLTDEEAIIEADSSGSELLFLYRCNDYWCISTSLYQLAEHIADKKFPLTINKVNIASNFINTSLFEQPLGYGQAYEEVTLLSKDECLIASKNYIKIEKKVSYKNYAFFDQMNFEDKVAYFFSFYRALISELSNNMIINMELSGSIYSRVLLALLKDDIASNKIQLQLDKSLSESNKIIIKAITELYDIELVPYKYSNIGMDDIYTKYQLFKYGNIGITRTEKRPRKNSGIFHTNIIKINDSVKSLENMLYNDNYLAYINVIAKSNLTKDSKSDVVNHLIRILDKYNYSNNHEAMEHLYNQYRKRYFSNQSWQDSLLEFVLSPFQHYMFNSILNSSDLEEFFHVDIQYIHKYNLVELYLLFSLNKELALIIVDENEQQFSLKDIERIAGILKRCNKRKVANNKIEYLKSMVTDEEVNHFISSNKMEYEDLIYNDIMNNFSFLEKSNILEEDYLAELKEKMHKRELTKSEEISILHAVLLLSFCHCEVNKHVDEK